ncbi:MAG TPA: hypothetical protein VFI73_01790 [Candidatus Nitrosopolaris sp.]|nr:hypothetical protein [Candidatus Nitrosopolaris sp.]
MLRRDLCVYDNDLKMLRAAEILEIDEIGCEYHGNSHENVIYRLNRPPSLITSYPYLVVSDKVGELSSPWLDIFIVRDYARMKSFLKKKVRARTGLEIFFADIRQTNGLGIGKWFEQTRDLYKLCNAINCQLVLSSGARSPKEMISGRCFDSILKLCNIKPESYWRDLEEWIDFRLGKKCYIDA